MRFCVGRLLRTGDFSLDPAGATEMARRHFGTMHCSMAPSAGCDQAIPSTPARITDLYLGLTRFNELAKDL